MSQARLPDSWWSTFVRPDVQPAKPRVHLRTVPQERRQLPGFTATPGFPLQREDCPSLRPCKWTSCRHHLWAEWERPGRRWYPGHRPPSRVVEHSTETCALDLAERGGMGRDEVARVMGVTPERVRQEEETAVRKLRLEALKQAHRDRACEPNCLFCEAERLAGD